MVSPCFIGQHTTVGVYVDQTGARKGRVEMEQTVSTRRTAFSCIPYKYVIFSKVALVFETPHAHNSIHLLKHGEGSVGLVENSRQQLTVNVRKREREKHEVSRYSN